MKAKEKGNQLEEAIERIEHAILGKHAGKGRPDIQIERNKRLKINGIGYEVDLLVTLNPDTNYETKFVFECKNWYAKKVRKNEVTDLIDTVEALEANKGYLMAKEFNSGAINKAKECKRIELLSVNDDIIAVYKEVRMHSMPIIEECLLSVYLVDSRSKLIDLKPEDIIVNSTGSKYSLWKVLFENEKNKNKILKDCAEYYDKKEEKGWINFDGRAEYEFEKPIDFKGKSFNNYLVRIEGKMFVYDEKLVSRYDIDKKGRYCVYEYLDKDGVVKTFSKTEVTPLDDKSGNSPERVYEFRFSSPLKS